MFTQNYGDSAYSHKPNGGENFSPTHWSKRKIVSNDNLMKLQKLISLDNVNANDEINIHETNCECRGACQSNCNDSCWGGCKGSCVAHCRDQCVGGLHGDFSTTRWSKRKIVSNDNLMKLQKSISLDNVNASDVINLHETNCECQAMCQMACVAACQMSCDGNGGGVFDSLLPQ